MSIKQGGKTIAGATQYHPDLFDFKWADHILDDAQWLMANPFSWQYGSMYQAVYQHLVDDYNSIPFTVNYYAWKRNDDELVYTTTATPDASSKLYDSNGIILSRTEIYSYTSSAIMVVSDYSERDGEYTRYADGDVGTRTAQTETIAGITVQFYLADDGHKICPASEEDKVLSIYNKTGNAWYYIIDTVNQRFKLPRAKHNKYANSLGVVGNGMALGLTDGTYNAGLLFNSGGTLQPYQGNYGGVIGIANSGGYINTIKSGGVTTDPTKSGIIAQQEQDTDQYKYLYFYVGAFTQTAIENTAGLNTELFNQKADLNLSNIASNIDYVVEKQEPTAGNNYTWYRKYKSGWVEQGGVILNARTGAHAITIPVEMASVDELKKSAITTPIFINGTIQNQGVTVRNSSDSSWSTTQIDCYSWGATIHIKWQVSGIAAN